jgi:hypothetical protein
MAIQQSLYPTLFQLEDLVTRLTNEQFTKPISILSNATIGQHVRHVIELFQTLEQGYTSGIVNYDNRKRDHLLESDCGAAKNELKNIAAGLQMPDKKLLIIGNYTLDSDKAIQVSSSYNRELIYNLEHTVHHMALIRIAIQQTTNLSLPPDFGIAASTIRNKKLCAQ